MNGGLSAITTTTSEIVPSNLKSGPHRASVRSSISFEPAAGLKVVLKAKSRTVVEVEVAVVM